MMTRDPITVEADADVREAGRLIAAKDHDQLPVVEHGRYLGMVTRLDVLEALTAS
jgi:CBS domain-containing protein